MGCYHPKIRVEDLWTWEKAADGHLYHPARIIAANDEAGESLENLENQITGFRYKKTPIPCRNCIGCRLDYSRQWANRGYLESKKSEHNYFITLTYSDENLTILDEIKTKDGITYVNGGDWNGTLIPEDATNFIKRFRKHLEKKYNITGWKYMLCGEYGGKTQRPHMHAILFNCPLPTKGFYNARIINKDHYWQNKDIEKCWQLGISNITIASWNTIAYVARYITKKINGTHSEDFYAANGQVKEFFRVSKGIAKEYYEENKDEIYKNDEIIVKNRNGANKIKPPKYFDNLRKKEDEKAVKTIKDKRQNRMKHVNRAGDDQTSVTRLEQLAIKERTHEEKHKQLVRRMEAEY